MKQKLFKSWLLMMCLLFGVGQSWAEDADYTLTPSAGSNNTYTGNCDVTVDGITWNVTGNAQMTPWRIGGKSITKVDRTVYSKTAYTSAVSKIDLTVGAASSITVNSLKLVYSTNADFSNSSEISKTFAANSTISFEADFPENAYYKFVFNVTVSGTSNKFVEFSKVEFYNKSGDDTPTTYTVTVDNNITNGTVTASTTSAKEGDEVTLEATPADGYEFGSWDVKDASNNKIDVKENKFKMPAANVNVSATFNKTQSGGEPSADGYTHDILTNADFKATSTTYEDFSGVSKNTAVYAGNSAKNNGVQLRSSNSNSGIVSTTSGGNIKKVTVTWNSNCTSGRTIDVYGKNSAYTSAADLYNVNKQGTKLGSIVMGTSTSVDVTGDYAYVGIRSNSGSLNIDDIDFAWEENTKTLTSITVKTAPTKVVYTEDEMFDPAGLVITATYDDENTKDIEYDTNTSAFTFSPSLTTALTPANENVTITYKEKSITQAITVNAIPTYKLTIIQPEDGGTLTVKNGDVTLESGASVRVGTNLTCEVTNIPEGKRFSRFYFDYNGQNKYKATNPATFDELPTEGFSEATVRVTYMDKQLYTINYMINGLNTDAQINVEEQTALVFPTPSAINEKAFVGWVESTIDEPTNEKPSFVNPVGLKATANKTYYAVFATKEGEGDPNMLTSVSGTITSGDYYLVDTYNNNKTYEYWAAQGGVSNQGINAKKLGDDNSTYITIAQDGSLNIDKSQLSDATMPSLYTITIGENEVVLKQGENIIYATYSTSTNNVNASLLGEQKDNTMNWNSVVGTGMTHQIKAVKGDERILMFMHHTSSGNKAEYFKSYAATSSNTGGGANENTYGSGNLYFLQAGVATYSDYTTAPYGTLTITLNAACHDTDDNDKVYATYSNDEKAWVVPEELTVAEINIANGALDVQPYATGAVVPANTGVMVSANAGGNYTVNVSTGGTSVLSGANLLHPSSEDMTGDNLFYRLTMHNGTQIGFWWGAEGGAAFNLAENKAYLAIPIQTALQFGYNPGGNGAKMVGLWIDGNTTGIDAIKDVNETNGVAYNLAGQRVNANAKGIVIINGKKVLKK